MKRATPNSTARSASTAVPRMLLRMASAGCDSIMGTCLCAAAWKTMSGRNRRNTWSIRFLWVMSPTLGMISVSPALAPNSCLLANLDDLTAAFRGCRRHGDDDLFEFQLGPDFRNGFRAASQNNAMYAAPQIEVVVEEYDGLQTEPRLFQEIFREGGAAVPGA